MTRYLVAHWGTYQVDEDLTVRPLPGDPAPSPIGLFQTHPRSRRCGSAVPSVRRSWLDRGPGANPERRGLDPFVEVPWDQAVDLVAAELKRVIAAHGNEAGVPAGPMAGPAPAGSITRRARSTGS